MAFGIARILDSGRELCTPAWNRRHWLHETYAKMYFVVRGAAAYENEAGSTRLAGGHLYFFPPHQRSKHSCPHEMDVHWLHASIDSPVIDQRMARIRTVQSWPLADWSYWEPVYARLDEFAERPGEELDLRIQAMMLHAFAELAHRHPQAEDPQLADELARFDPALRFMDTHFRRNPPLAEIAASAGLSEVYFHRRFTSVFKVTPHAYLLRRRMDLAHQLLSGTAQSIREIANASGYADQFYFSRVFKRWFEVSPERFRAARVRKP
jgi:AraC-like DNA-binding protein